MVDFGENNAHVIVKHSLLQDETRSGKFVEEMKQGSKRKVLGVINQNLVCAKAYSRNSLFKFHEKMKKMKKMKKLKTSAPMLLEKPNKLMVTTLKPTLMNQYDLKELKIGQEEVEMEEQILDIDCLDMENSLTAVEYVQDLYEFYRKSERFSCVSVDYMDQQLDINEKMRAILIDWLIEVHDKFELMNETLFLTVNLIDRFLSKQSVVRKKLQLVGLVALLLACKYEEVSVLVIEDLILISDNTYTRKDVLEMEQKMLYTLQFNVSLPTQYPFLKRFLKAAQANKKCEMLALFLSELALVEYEMLQFPPSLLAATAVYNAQSTLHGFRQWNSTCQFHCYYSQDQLIECSTKMASLHQKVAIENLRGVYRKYNTFKFGYIAKCEAPHFLLSNSLG